MLASPGYHFAHSGGTDRSGGHHDHKNGGYHFHHGFGPHQHPFGICALKKNIDGIRSNQSSSALNTWGGQYSRYISFKYLSILLIGLGLGRYLKLKGSNSD